MSRTGLRKGHLAWILAPTLIASACHRDTTEPAGSPDPDAVAVFRGGEVLRSELDAYIHQDREEDPQVAGAQESDWRVVAIRQLALTQVLAAEAPPENRAIDAAVLQAVDGLLRAAMVRELGWEEIRATEEEARRQYDSHPEQYIDPEKLRLQHIFLRAEQNVLSAGERERVRQKLEGIRQEILAGAEFSAMAQQYSESATAHAGGWITLRTDSKAFPGFTQEVWGLETGEISEIIDTPTGFQLVKLVARSETLERQYEDVAEFAHRRALQEKVAAAQDEFVREVGPRHGLEKHHDRLSDPFIEDDAALILLGEGRYTFRNLRESLPQQYLIQLYNGYLPKVHEFLDQVALDRLLAAEAERLDLASRPEVAQQIEAVTLNARASYAMSRRLDEKMAAVPAAEVRDYFAQNEQRYQTLRNRDVDIVLLQPETGEPLWKTLKRGEALVERIRAGEDFAEIARAHSQHYSAANGGRIEHLTDHGVGQIVQSRARFRRVLNALEEGEVSEAMVAETYDPEQLKFLPTGVIFVRLVKLYPPVQQEFEAVEDMVRSNYLRRHYEQIENDVRDEILEAIELEILFDRLPPL